MKLLVLIAFFAVLVTTVWGWEKEDYEIFDLVSAIEASEGRGTTFYSWLDVPNTATTAEIAKAYRKMSMQLHPDKNPNDKKIHERFARLGVVSTILRNKESRERYDFFYKNGVPKWRGTGYYYSRFRPGLGSVLVFLTIFTSIMQLVVQRMNYNRDVLRIERFIKEARLAAWGPRQIPIEGRRKVKVNLGGSSRYDEDGNATAGRSIDMVVEGQRVYILDPTGEMHLLDVSAAVRPTFSNTWFLALIKSLFYKALSAKGRPNGDISSTNGTGGTSEQEEDDESSTGASDIPGSGTATPREDATAVRVGAGKAAKRKKAARKR